MYVCMVCVCVCVCVCSVSICVRMLLCCVLWCVVVSNQSYILPPLTPSITHPSPPYHPLTSPLTTPRCPLPSHPRPLYRQGLTWGTHGTHLELEYVNILTGLYVNRLHGVPILYLSSPSFWKLYSNFNPPSIIHVSINANGTHCNLKCVLKLFALHLPINPLIFLTH